MADVFGAEIVTVNVSQGAAYGAALLAGVGTGVYADAQEACRRTIRETGSTRPGPNRATYEDYYQRYRALYPKLKDEFALLAQTAQRYQSGIEATKTRAASDAVPKTRNGDERTKHKDTKNTKVQDRRRNRIHHKGPKTPRIRSRKRR